MAPSRPTPPLDRFERPLRNLRISVTDRCNLRCGYCMPEADYVWLPRRDLLSFEEIDRLADAFLDLGVDKIRLTGGEPLLRRDLHRLVAKLAEKPRVRDLALTTNGLLLAEQAAALFAAGLSRVTVSLDTLRADRFREIAQRPGLERVLEGLDAADRAGFRRTKLDAVVLRGTNDDELDDLIAFGRERGIEVRFIEYMDVGGATRWSMDAVVPRDEILARLARTRGPIEPVDEPGSTAPADRYRLADGTVFGIIASTTAPFCGTCDRARLTADGFWYLCLYARVGTDLRTPLRRGDTPEEIRELVRRAWRARADRGAEERLGIAERSVLAPADEMRGDPHLEMHTRGG